MLLLGIIGHPLAHTLSPVLHNWALAQKQIPGAYYLWDTPSHKLSTFVTAVRTLPIDGVSVTIPHKEAIIPFLDDLTPNARTIGAVNTLFWQENRLVGDNTDITGFMAPLVEKQIAPGMALILGAGGAARAALYGLHQAGWKIFLTSRTHKHTQQLAQELGVHALSWDNRYDVQPDLLVNTTPLGMMGKFQSQSPWEKTLDGISFIYDLVYNPQQTLLVKQGLHQRKEIVYGMHMFVHQALAQFKRWTDSYFCVDAATILLEQILNKHQRDS